jgi:hypothetical protein
MKKNQNNTVDYHYKSILSYSPVPHSYSVHLILLSILLFRRRRKEMISTEDEGVPNADIPKERGVM